MNESAYHDFIYIKDALQLVRMSNPDLPCFVFCCSNLDPLHLLWTLRHEAEGDIDVFYQGFSPFNDALRAFMADIGDKSLIYLRYTCFSSLYFCVISCVCVCVFF